MIFSQKKNDFLILLLIYDEKISHKTFEFILMRECTIVSMRSVNDTLDISAFAHRQSLFIHLDVSRRSKKKKKKCSLVQRCQNGLEKYTNFLFFFVLLKFAFNHTIESKENKKIAFIISLLNFVFLEKLQAFKTTFAPNLY